MEIISDILSAFGIPTSDIRCETLNSGHINVTFKVYSGNSCYIVQKLNTHVFQNPEQVMHNVGIAQRLWKSELDSLSDSGRRFPEYLEADGKNYLIKNGFWRVYPFIESVSAMPDADSVRAFGRLLGEFHRCTEKADISELFITMPDFHNIEKNISQLFRSKELSPEQKTAFSRILDFYRKNKSCFSEKRLVHNDVKWANVLISPHTLLPETLIDFDTIMSGYAAFDFGDGVRSVCESDGIIDSKMLYRFADGYFSEYRSISPEEITVGIISVTAELSARYLWDCLSKSGYFSGLSYTEKMKKHRKNLRLAEYALENAELITSIISSAKNGR